MQVESPAEERELLIRLVERPLSDTRGTKTPDFHDRLQVEEQQLSALLARLRAVAGA